MESAPTVRPFLFLENCLLIRRIRFDHRPVSRVAKELGVSHQCAHR